MKWSQAPPTSLLSMVLLVLTNNAEARTGTRIRRQDGPRFHQLQIPESNGTGDVPGDNEHVFMAQDNLFQHEGCPYAISEMEAMRKELDPEIPGNVIHLTRQCNGRAGNHFLAISAYLAMGFCCRSRVLVLPEKDTKFPRIDGVPFEAKTRWFSFSQAQMPWEEYMDLQKDARACRPVTRDGGDKTFFLEDVNKKLLGCMNRVYLRGCEEAYLGKITDVSGICSANYSSKTPGKAGLLAIHIRSGDVFHPKVGKGGAQRAYGQPPLQFLLLTIQAFEWDDVVVMTAGDEGVINPLFIVLERMAETGILGQSTHFYKNRSLLEDIHTMLCADALVIARSTLGFLTLAHTRATKFFIPTPCGRGRYRREKGTAIMSAPENTTLLMLEKPDAEVYGIDHVDGGLNNYSVYHEWKATTTQMMTMMTFDGVKKLRRCKLSDDFGIST